MPITVTERKIDKKRRVTLPPNINLKEGYEKTILSLRDLYEIDILVTGDIAEGRGRQTDKR